MSYVYIILLYIGIRYTFENRQFVHIIGTLLLYTSYRQHTIILQGA